MKIFKNIRYDDTPLFIYIIFITVSAFFLLFYLQYGIKAWFFQDDFLWLFHFKNSMRMYDDFISNANLGRFIGHNIYWNIMYNIAGFNATVYFIFNLLILIINTFLLYKFLLKIIKDKDIAIFSATIYFIMLPTIINYTWISNANHILAHLFVFLFCNLYFDEKYIDNLTINKMLILLIIFHCAVLSNQTPIFFLPCIIIYHFLYLKEHPLKKNNVILLGIITVLLAMYLIIIFKIHKSIIVSDSYTTDLSPSNFLATTQFYIKYYFKNIFVFLIMTGIISFGFIKKDKLIIFLFLSAILCFIPFGFTEHQRMLNYPAISFILLNISILIIIKKYLKIQILLPVLLIYNLYIDMPRMKNLSEAPYGSRVKVLIDEMRCMVHQNIFGKYNKIYFKSIEQQINNTVFKEYDYPIFWIRFGGSSIPDELLKTFINPNIEYCVLKYDETVPDKYPLILMSNDILFLDDGIKKVILPNK